MEDESKKILNGGFNFSVPIHMNYGKLFVDKILEYGTKIAMIHADTEEQITFAEMAQSIVNVAYALKQLDMKRGEVVAICSENRIEFMTTAMAVSYSGAVLTFLNTAFSKDEMINIAKISKPKYVFMSPNAYDVHYKTLKNLNEIKQYFIYGKDKGHDDLICFEELVAKFVSMELYKGENFYGQAHTALILYSSGTTGLPKGVRLTHLNYITTAYQVPVTWRTLTMLTVVPFANTMGLQGTNDGLINGKTVVFLTRFSEEAYLKAIEKYKVGYILVAPPIMVMLCKSMILQKYDLTSLEVAISGGAPLDRNMLEELKSKIPNLQHILQGYGMTETSGVISKENDLESKFGSVGKIAVGLMGKIVDIETRKPLGPGERGELCVKGTSIFQEYIGKNMDEFQDNGYFKTGDIVYYDGDGFIFVVDRIKELIKYKAWQVTPSELEAILLQHENVRDAAVIGAPDKEAGELPTAFVVKNSGANVTSQDIIEFVNAKVSPWKRLRGGVRFVEEIPKNPSGKILRRLLRASLIKPASKL